MEYSLTGIDVAFWRKVKAKAAMQGTTIKAIILQLLNEWLEEE